MDPIHVFRVEDGETHHVVAKHPAHVIDLVAESFGMTPEEYRKEHEPEVHRLEPYELIRFRVDDEGPRPKDIPDGASCERKVVGAASAWIERGTYGVICSTVY